MKTIADIVIIGGGVVGCSIAYYLAKRGFKNIVLIEKNYITSGSTGRCAANFKEQWENRAKCEMGKFSVKQFDVLGEETGFGDLEVVHNGYMFAIYKEEQVKEFTKRLEFQRSLGIPEQQLTPEEVKELMPGFNIENLLAGFLNMEDGHINPFKLTFAYVKGAQKLGVEFNTYTEVIDILTSHGKIQAVVTNKGVIQTPVVINATEAEGKNINRMVGIYCPIESQKHEILITEPLDYIQYPMITSYDAGIYIHQMPNGGFILGSLDTSMRMGNIDYNHSWKFIEEISKKAVKVFPDFKNIHIIRQWAGHYGMTPDMNVILGPVPEVEGFLLGIGAAKGMMMSPAIGTLMAEILAGDKESDSAIPIKKADVGMGRFNDYFINPGGSSKKNMDRVS